MVETKKQTMKKIMLVAVVLLIGIHSYSYAGGGTVKETLQQTFHKNFPSAENVHWIDNPEGYTVSFTLKGIITRINYDSKGKFKGSVRNYTEQFLPFYLINVLKQEYPGQEIYGVTEITTATDISYFVKLESEKYWTTVRVDNDGNTAVTERLRKAN
jgi:hypothetical protein